jgi:hypothetical protein
LTQEQTIAKLLVLALHKLGGSLEVSQQLLDNLGSYHIVWEPHEDQVSVKVTVKSGEILIAHVDSTGVAVVPSSV